MTIPFYILGDGAFIFGIFVPYQAYDKAFPMVKNKFLTCDLDCDRWPTFEKL